MSAVMQRPGAFRDSTRMIVRILAVVAAGFLTGACLGLGALAVYDALRVNQPILYSPE
jgi:hypothetical protein